MRPFHVSFLLAAVAGAGDAAVVAQATWSQLYPVGQPLPRQDPSLVCFEPTGEVLMLFGVAAGAPVSQHWRLLGNTWSPFPSPPFLAYTRDAVYDAGRQRVVTFASDASHNDVYEWNGTAWTSPGAFVRPVARSGFGMAYDRVRGVTVLFGGLDTFGSRLEDLWEWNGMAWVQRATTTPPGPRAFCKLAFDPEHGNVLLHGGLRQILSSSLVLNDTWAWNGTTWTQYQPTLTPTYEISFALATDLHRRRIVRHGGIAGSPTTFEWDGSDWRPVLTSSPGPRQQMGLAYDTAQRRIVMFGGTTTGFFVHDTWVYRTAVPADVVPFGSGCAGTVGTPALANAPYVYPWLGDTMRTVVQPIPAGEPGAVFVSSFGGTPPLSLGFAGAPGCDLLVPVDVAEFRAAAAGRAEWELAIPNVPALAGVVFRQQAFVFDAPANALGLVASNGVTVTTGVR